MRLVRFGLCSLSLLVATSAAAQVQIKADRVALGAATMQSGSGSPESVVTAPIGSTFYRTDTGRVYLKTSGTGNTGWTAISAVAPYVAGDLIYANTTASVARLAAVASGQVLASTGVGTVPGYTASPSLTSIGGAAGLTLNPTGDVVLTPGSGLTKVTTSIQSPGFVSQLTGWRATNLGEGDFRHLFADELHAKSFIADLEQALAGGQIIAKSVAVLASDFTCPVLGGTTTLTVEDLPGASGMQVFQANDWVILHNFNRSGGVLAIDRCVGTVSSPSTPGGTQSWTFTRGTGGNGGAMAPSTVVQADTLVIDYGVSGNGFYEVNAVDGLNALNSPYAQIVTWATSPVVANRTLRSRFGNLRGITSVADEFGIIAGTFAATNGQYFRASNSAFELHGIDLRMWDGATNVFRVDRGGGTAPFLSLGSPAPTTFASGTGVWMGDDGGTYKFRVGNPSGDKLEWDGTTLTVSGRVTIGTGRNLLPNSEFRRESSSAFGASTGGAFPSPLFGPQTGMASPGATVGISGDGRYWLLGGYAGTGSPVWDWRCNRGGTFPKGSGSCFITATVAAPSANAIKEAYGPIVAAGVGERWEFSLYGLIDGIVASVRAELLYYNSANTLIGRDEGTNNIDIGGDVTLIGSYDRAWVIATTPVNTAYIIPNIRVHYSASPTVPNNAVITRVYLGRAQPGQTQPTPWAPGGVTLIDGSMLNTDMVLTNTIRGGSATALATGTGFWLDATSTPTFRVGDPAGNQIKWDGTNVTVKAGNMQIDGSTIKIAVVDSGSVFDSSRGYTFDVTDGWLGIGGADGPSNGRFLSMQAAYTPGTRNAITEIEAISGAEHARVSAVSHGSGVSFIRLLADELLLNGMTTSGTAGSLSGYITITVNETLVKVPFYTP